mgnify:CR=1 FL=1
MVSFIKKHGQLLKPKLKRLQELQTEIFRQLQILMPGDYALYDSFQSQVPGSPLLKMDVLERHPYTHFLRLTYQFEKDEQHEIAPDAHIRLYNDARMAEVTSFNADQGFNRSIHPWYPGQPLLQRSWHQNRALDKWLGYLLHQGHNVKTMLPSSSKISGKEAIPVKHSANISRR